MPADVDVIMLYLRLSGLASNQSWFFVFFFWGGGGGGDAYTLPVPTPMVYLSYINA